MDGDHTGSKSDVTENDDWCVDCSDEEKYDIKSKWMKAGNMVVPPAEDIASLHEVLCMDRVIALEWHCYGRKLPTENKQEVQHEPEVKELEKSDDDFFDFGMDDLPSQPKLPVRRREGELKGGARKKTTSFDGILSNMKRHWKLDNEPPNT